MRTAVPLMGASKVTMPNLPKALAHASLSAMGKVLVSMTMGLCAHCDLGRAAIDWVTWAKACEVDKETITTSDWLATSAALPRH